MTVTERMQRWRWLGVEFLVIVMGVLSALFVDTWIDDRQDAERAEVYRQRLIADLERDVGNLDAVAQYYRGIRAHGLAVLADIEGGEPMDDFSLAFSAFNAAEEWGFQLANATYLDLQSTGNLALVEDVTLRLELTNYNRQAVTRERVWELPRAFRATARGIIPDDLQAAIHEECEAFTRDVMQLADDAGATGSRFSAVAGVSEDSDVRTLLSAAADWSSHCGLDPADFDVARAARILREDPVVERQLRFRMSEVRVAIGLFQGQREMALALLERLREGA